MSNELINKAFELKDVRREALKNKDFKLAESLLKEYQAILSEIPKDLVFAVGVY